MSKSNFEEILGFSPFISSNSLYALCDFETLLKKNLSLYDFILLCKKNSVKILQYRDKISSNDIQIKHLNSLKSELNIPIIINDKIDLIQYCDGLHLGQEDLTKVNKNKIIAIKLIRARIKNKLLGLSTHNEIEILEANTLDIDMIGLGAYRATKTKDIDFILGEKISYLAKMSKHPVCIIGGVKKDDLVNNANFNVVGSDLYE
ncbi:MAG: thiamine phosphate synthase [Campylobacteraceae bacterium]|nr:thiamine phosphate synthase [Campylobacteraceae bacterium]